MAGREPREIERETMLLGIAPDAAEAEAVGPGPVDRAQTIEHVAAVVLPGPRRRARVAHGLEREGPRRRGHPLARKHPHVFGMLDRQQARPVEVEHLLELVGHAQLDPSVAGADTLPGQAHVLLGVGRVAEAGGQPGAHLPPAQEIRHELEPGSVPGEQERAGRGLAVQLDEREHGRGRVRQLRLEDPRGPEDPDRIRLLACAQAEHHVGGGHRRRGGRGFDPLAQASRSHVHLGPDAVPAADPALEAHLERAVGAALGASQCPAFPAGQHQIDAGRPRRGRRRRGRPRSSGPRPPAP